MTRKIKKSEQKEIDIKRREALITLWKLKEKLGIANKYHANDIIINSDKMRFLVDNYRKISNEEMAKKIGFKSIHSLTQWLNIFNLNTVYVDEYEYCFNELYNILSGCNPNNYTLSYVIEKHGCPIYRKDGNSLKMINLLEFYEWLNDHRKIMNLHSYEVGSLPVEPDWFLEKVNADKRAYEYVYKRKWTESEDNRLKQMISEKKTYKEITTELKRTGSAVKRRCYDLKISKPRRVPQRYWTAEELALVKDLWLKGYEPCIIAEELSKLPPTMNFINLPKDKRYLKLKTMYARSGEGRSDREVTSILERYEYFGAPREKFNV